MGFAKLNVWVRSLDCQVVNKPFVTHVYNCHSVEIVPPTWNSNGHGEIQVPPGCYIVQAKVCQLPGNFFTDRAVVMVRCGEEACANLVLPRYGLDKLQHALQPLTLHYCPAALMPALVYNAQKEKIDPKELGMAVDVIAKAAKMDKSTMLEVVKAEIKVLEEGKAKIKGKELEEVTEYLDQLKRFVDRKT